MNATLTRHSATLTRGNSLLLQHVARPWTLRSATRSCQPVRLFASAPGSSAAAVQVPPKTSDWNPSLIRNIGIIAHVDAGKTTTTERMLYYAGHTKRIGNVDEGSTVTDFLPQERERGITIQSAAITFGWLLPSRTSPPAALKINLIDTPGHVDFTFEVERSLRVLDGAITVLDGVAGVEAQTATVWHQANRYAIPRIVFVNKMDRAGASLERAMDGIRTKLRGWGVPVNVQVPVIRQDGWLGTGSGIRGIIDVVESEYIEWTDEGVMSKQPVTAALGDDVWAAYGSARSDLVDVLSTVSDAVLESALDLDDPALVPADLLHEALRTATLTGQAVPVFVGAAFRNMGVQPVLDAVGRYLPSPVDRPPVPAVIAKEGGKEVMVRMEDQKMCALAFKVVFDGKRGYMTYVRVYSGTLHNKQQVLNTSTNAKERINKLLLMYASSSEELDSVSAGNIAVLLGLKDTRTGDTLTSLTPPSAPLTLSGLPIPAPVFTCSIEPSSSSASKLLDTALAHLTREDPSVVVAEDKETGQLLIGGQGELHLEIIKDRLTREYGVDARMGDMQIAYREAISEPADVTDTYVRESGPAGSGAASISVKVGVLVEPMPRNAADGLVPSDAAVHVEIKAKAVDAETRHFAGISARAALSSGPVRGAPVANVKVVVHTLEVPEGGPSAGNAGAGSAASAVHWAVSRALRAAAPQAIEPIVQLKVVVPGMHTGSVIRDLNRRGARVAHVGARDEDAELGAEGAAVQVVEAMAPLAQLVGYSTGLRKVSAGAGTFEMAVVGYETVGSFGGVGAE
ncbi:P-loop containing nucleoside triphosphate hydrolase protein [Catenaria anguillulae PL171]|uniref:Elongation factor 2 n=1 Tax=Catenaria anguillulae PL171 TaxID=765915 RepID=A0A1Y2H999_9FUNG|nr:P-loop containing nucleoside triphosphate hydrolase protein [Catenaria anguillulae PL171]